MRDMTCYLAKIKIGWYAVCGARIQKSLLRGMLHIAKIIFFQSYNQLVARNQYSFNPFG